MSNRKISELTSLTAVAGDDVLPIVDISETDNSTKNKKITVSELLRSAPDGNAAAPAFSFESDDGNGVFLAGTDTVGISTGGTQRVTVDGSGNVTISGDLTVSGATTTVESTTVTIDDKNIELGSVATPTDTTADGGGITLKGATDKTLKWINSTGCWTFNQPMNFNDHVRIDSSGNVGIGTTSPAEELEVQAATNATIRIDNEDDSTAKLYFHNTGSTDMDISVSSANMTFNHGASERLRIDSSGQVIIGGTTPLDSTKQLTLTTTATSGGLGILSPNNGRGDIFFGDAADDNVGQIRYSHVDNSMTLRTNTADRFVIDSSGNVGIGTSSPGVNLEIVSTSINSIAKLKSSSSTNGGQLQVNGTDFIVRNRDNGNVEFWTNDSERMQIDSSGRLLVGTSSALVGNTSVNIQATASTGSRIALGRNDTTTVTDSIIGGITFRGNDSNGTYQECAYIFANAESAHGDDDKPTYLKFATTADGASSATERLRIDSSGRVGIGTTAPPRSLTNANDVTLTTGTAPQYRLNGTAGDGNDDDRAIFGLATASNHFVSGAVAGDAVLRTTNGGNLLFGVGTTERLRIDSSGNVGIGVSSPSQKLDVGGGSIKTTAGLFFGSTASYLYESANDTVSLRIGSDGPYLRFKDVGSNVAELGNASGELALTAGGAEKVRIKNNGRVGIGTSSIDERLHVEGNTTNERIKIENTTSNIAGFVMLNTSRRYDVQVNGSDLQVYDNTGSAERLRIDSAGRVGIGTSSPATTLELKSDANAQTTATIPTLRITNDDGSAVANDITGSVEFFSEDTSDPDHVSGFMRAISETSAGVSYALTFGTKSGTIGDAAERLRIDNSGKVGIGVSSPTNQLHIFDDNAANDRAELKIESFRPGIRFQDRSSSSSSAEIVADNNLMFRVSVPVNDDTALTERMRLTNAGRLGIGTSSPNEALDVSGNVELSGQLIQSMPTDFWNQGNTFIELNSMGNLTHQGSFETCLTSNGYRNSNVQWTSYGINNTTGASQVRLNPTGYIVFATESNKATGDPHQVTERMLIDSSGNVGIGTTSPQEQLHVSGTSDFVVDTTGSTVRFGSYGEHDIALVTGRNTPSLSTRVTIENGNGEAARLDSSGRLLVGLSSSIPVSGNVEGTLQVAGTRNSFTRYGNDVYGPTISLGKSRGSVGSFTSVSANDTLGILQWAGSDGTDLKSEAARIEAQVDGTPGSNDMPGRLIFSTTADGASSPTERLRIDSSGRVGIGTTGPDEKLDVSGTNDIKAVIQTTSTGVGANAALRLRTGEYNWVIQTGGSVSGGLRFYDSGNSSERARIDSSGRLLVGLSSSIGDANARLQIAGVSGAAPSVILARPDTSVSAGQVIGSIIGYGNDSNGTYQQVGEIAIKADLDHGDNDKPGRITFSTTADAASSPTERMRIDSSGNLLLGQSSTINPASGNVVGASLQASGQFNNTVDGGIVANFNRKTSEGDCVRFRKDGTVVGSVSVTASATAFNESSDHRLKENIVDIADGITRVKQLQPRRFNFIVEPKTTVDGFVAHEAQIVVPEAVTGTHNEVDDDGNPVMQQIDKSKFVPLLTAALQEAIAKIETLEAKVAALEAQ